MKNWIIYNWLRLLAVGFLGGAYWLAISETAVPFAYYQYMNWIVLGASLVTAEQANVQNKMFHIWLFLLVAVTFNPVAPMYFRADIWQLTDLVVALIFLISLFSLRSKNS